jgi:hypothetical protein
VTSSLRRGALPLAILLAAELRRVPALTSHVPRQQLAASRWRWLLLAHQTDMLRLEGKGIDYCISAVDDDPDNCGLSRHGTADDLMKGQPPPIDTRRPRV